MLLANESVIRFKYLAIFKIRVNLISLDISFFLALFISHCLLSSDLLQLLRASRSSDDGRLIFFKLLHYSSCSTSNILFAPTYTIILQGNRHSYTSPHVMIRAAVASLSCGEPISNVKTLGEVIDY